MSVLQESVLQNLI